MSTWPSSLTSIWDSYSSDRPRIVSPPLPMSRPIWLWSILIFEIRGACGDSSALGAAMTSAHLPEDVHPGLAGLGERVAQDVERDARDLDVHLEGGDAVLVPATLKSMSPRWSSTPAMSVSTV
jgi:hypothetical protein